VFIDSHCHLAYNDLFCDIDHYINLMLNNKVVQALCVATNVQDQLRVIELINKYDFIFGSVGIHPDEILADNFYLTEQYLYDIALHDKIIAIGETGLDYYRLDLLNDQQQIALQKDRFIKHMNVAVKLNLPLIIHTRGNSYDDVLNMMQEHNVKKAVMHCFTENIEVAKRSLELGYYISISGIVTFKNASTVQEVAKYIPIDRLLIETDAPFLAPTPFRGKLNHPGLLVHTAQYIAGLRNMSIEQIANNTTDNFNQLFLKQI
jgi:TatD DNase family protein